MKKLSAVHIIAILLLASCQKSNNSGSAPSPYYINVTIDGVPRVFNNDAMAVKTSIDSIFNFGISGNPGNGGEGIGLSIENRPGIKPLVAGTYTQSNKDFTISAMYNPNSTVYIYSAGYNYNSGQYLNPPNPLVITISSIDSNTVRGTFSGDFYFQYGSGAIVSGPDKKTLTGDFYLKMQFLH